MIRNNVLSFVFYILAIIFNILVLSVWSQIMYLGFMNTFMLSCLGLITLIIPCFLSGYFLFKKQRNTFFDYISCSSISVICILLFIMCHFGEPSVFIDKPSRFLILSFYDYNFISIIGYVLYRMKDYINVNDEISGIIYVLFSFIPSFIFLLAIQLRQLRLQRQFNQKV